jgi:hypothetical protein
MGEFIDFQGWKSKQTRPLSVWVNVFQHLARVDRLCKISYIARLPFPDPLSRKRILLESV